MHPGSPRLTDSKGSRQAFLYRKLICREGSSPQAYHQLCIVLIEPPRPNFPTENFQRVRFRQAPCIGTSWGFPKGPRRSLWRLLCALSSRRRKGSFPEKEVFSLYHKFIKKQLCRSGRDGPLLSSQKKVGKDWQGASPLDPRRHVGGRLVNSSSSRPAWAAKWELATFAKTE